MPDKSGRLNHFKKLYKKPQVTNVHLLAKEAVLGNCKSSIAGHSACQLAGDPNCVPAETSRS